jgi:hypothetical protein
MPAVVSVKMFSISSNGGFTEPSPFKIEFQSRNKKKGKILSRTRIGSLAFPKVKEPM